MRLEARSQLKPKGCLRLGPRTIVEESILRLLSGGIERIVIVTGHLAEQHNP
jgi:2-aminoethylphosphonate-pyruvate transaminase